MSVKSPVGFCRKDIKPRPTARTPLDLFQIVERGDDFYDGHVILSARRKTRRSYKTYKPYWNDGIMYTE